MTLEEIAVCKLGIDDVNATIMSLSIVANNEKIGNILREAVDKITEADTVLDEIIEGLSDDEAEELEEMLETLDTTSDEEWFEDDDEWLDDNEEE